MSLLLLLAPFAFSCSKISHFNAVKWAKHSFDFSCVWHHRSSSCDQLSSFTSARADIPAFQEDYKRVVKTAQHSIWHVRMFSLFFFFPSSAVFFFREKLSVVIRCQYIMFPIHSRCCCFHTWTNRNCFHFSFSHIFLIIIFLLHLVFSVNVRINLPHTTVGCRPGSREKVRLGKRGEISHWQRLVSWLNKSSEERRDHWEDN